MAKILKRRSVTTRSWTAAAVGVATLALAVAGCGSSGGRQPAGYGASSPSAAASGGSGGASVGLASSTLGKILVDGKGQMTATTRSSSEGQRNRQAALRHGGPRLRERPKLRGARPAVPGPARRRTIPKISDRQ